MRKRIMSGIALLAALAARGFLPRRVKVRPRFPSDAYRETRSYEASRLRMVRAARKRAMRRARNQERAWRAAHAKARAALMT